MTDGIELYETYSAYIEASVAIASRELVPTGAADREDYKNYLRHEVWLALRRYDPTKSSAKAFISLVVTRKKCRMMRNIGKELKRYECLDEDTSTN